MTTYCTDVDLIQWEPNLLKDAAFASQTLIAGTANLAGSTLTIPQSLTRACAMGTLQMIYSALAAVSGAPAEYKVRAELYEKLYGRAMRSARVELDLNGDGIADCRRDLSVLQLTRQ